MMSVVFVLKFGVMQETNNISWLDFYNFNYHAVGVWNLNNTTSEFQNTSLNIWISLKNYGLYAVLEKWIFLNFWEPFLKDNKF